MKNVFAVFMFQDSFCTTQADLEKALHSTVPSTQRGSDILVDYRPVVWDEIGGLENVKQQLKQVRCFQNDPLYIF